MGKLVYLWFAVKTVFCTCQPDHRVNDFKKVRSHYKISKIGKLSAEANESSGLAKVHGKNSLWTNNDSGGKPELYEIDSTGKLLSTRKINDAQNKDWEDLTTDKKGNVYIGDFGNNSNSRKDLKVYIVPENDTRTETISFKYEDQTTFPPSAKLLNFDCEAFFYHDNFLYLFSKNRGSSKSVKLYKLSATPGNYSIAATDSITIKTQVTSADISPDGKTFALLTYGKILLFGIDGKGINFKQPIGCFRFVKKQSEALIFLNNTDLLVTNEQKDVFRITYR